MKDYVNELIEYRNREIEAYQNLDLNDVNVVLNLFEEARLNGFHFFVCGNGGSASTASHYAGDFNKGVNMGLLSIDTHTHKYPVAGIIKDSAIPLYNFECLSDNIPTMMAVSNDDTYDEVFRYPLSVKMKKGDILIGISGSGNSKNIINAFDYAKSVGGKTVAIVGYDGGEMKKKADYCIHININNMQVSEDIHMILDHMMMSVLCHRNY